MGGALFPKDPPPPGDQLRPKKTLPRPKGHWRQKSKEERSGHTVEAVASYKKLTDSFLQD